MGLSLREAQGSVDEILAFAFRAFFQREAHVATPCLDQSAGGSGAGREVAVI